MVKYERGFNLKDVKKKKRREREKKYLYLAFSPKEANMKY
jgi:hypothetical protein